MPISKSEPRVSPPKNSLPVPKRIGRYEVIDRLATGGMAEIFICCERGMAGLERLVVIKRILPHLAVHDSFVDMFLAEARYVARLNHPNVVQIYELGEDNGTPYLAMEYVAGSSVRDVLIAAIEREVATPTGAGIALVAQACAGAHAAHELADPTGKALGLVHRDISPHNLMTTSEGHVKLLDFGIAKATEMAELDEHTRTGSLKGKVHYMAPEQIRQEPLDRRADVFALGIVLWELLAQERLFKRDSELESMQAIVGGDLRDLSKHRPDIPKGIVQAVERALRRNKSERYTSADEMRHALVDACARVNVRTDLDAAGAFVHPLVGDRLSKRTAELVDLAQERTRATPSSSRTGGSHLDDDDGDETVVDKRGGNAVTKAVEGVAVRGASLPSVSLDAVTTAPARQSPVAVAVVPPPARPKRQLRAAAAIAMLVVGVGALAFGIATRKPTYKGPPLTVAFAPLADANAMRTDLEPFADYLAAALDRPVTIVVPASYDVLSDDLVSGRVDLAVLPPLAYVTTAERERRIEPLAVKLADGSSGSDGLIYIAEGSAARSLADLKGKRFCFTDELSTTGYLLPRLAIREAGLDPDKDVLGRLSGSHEAALRDLTSGRCEAAATYNGGYLAADRAGVPVSRTRQLALTGHTPQDAVCAGPGVSATERQRITRALLSYRPTRVDESRAERLSGFAPITDRDYDRIREAKARDARHR